MIELVRIERALRRGAFVAYARPEDVLARVPAPELLALLSDAERGRYARFDCAPAAELYLVAHALLHGLLARVLRVDPGALTFASAEGGRPELAGSAAHSRMRFNLSHTAGLAVCALSRHVDVGVDVEHLGRALPSAGAAARVLSASEQAGLDSLDAGARRARFFELWTLKEAYGKAIGRGLAAPLTAVSFDAAHADPVPARFCADSGERDDAWCFRRHVAPPAHHIAVALRAGRDAAVQFADLSHAAWWRPA